MYNAVFWSIWAIIGIIMLIFYGRTKRPVKNAVVGMSLGGIGLVSVHFLGGYIGITLALNLFNTTISLLLGVPGVILLVVGNFLT